MGRMDVLMAVLDYLDHGRWETELCKYQCFRTRHPKLMSLRMCWKGFTFLPKASQGSCGMLFSILTALSSSGGCINIDHRYSLFWE